MANRRAEQAQVQFTEMHGNEKADVLQRKQRKQSSQGGGRPLTAEKRQALAERNRKHIENRAAALQAVKEQQTRRANVQSKICSKVSVLNVVLNIYILSVQPKMFYMFLDMCVGTLSMEEVVSGCCCAGWCESRSRCK